MFKDDIPEGAFLSPQLFMVFVMQLGIHPMMVPWNYVNYTSEELLKLFGGTDDVQPEELPAEPDK